MDYESNEPRVHLDAGDLQEPHRFRPSEDTPFCIAVLGDFSGRGAAEATDPEAMRTGTPSWNPIRVTPDNMVELAGRRPRLELSLSGGQGDHLELEFRGLEDFHPDRLYRSLPLFAELRDSRAAVKAGGAATLSFAESPGEAENAEEAAGRPSPRPTDPPDEARRSDEEILEAILGEKPAAKPPEASADRELRDFVREVVRPHLVRRAPDRSAELAAIDRATGALMRTVLHHENFQALESLWRSVVLLLSRTDSSGKIRVFIVDVTKQELERDLLGDGDPIRSCLHELMTAPDLGAAASRWSLTVGAYTFGASPGEAALLEQVGAVAKAADVPWLSAGDPRLAGCTSLQASPDPRDWSTPWEDEWAGVPESPGARWLGLALPSFLVREPYGADTGRRCKAFAFEENLATRGAEARPGGRTEERALLWGNPAFACAALLAQSFARSGWGFSPNSVLDLGQVPLAGSGSKEERGPVITEAAITRSGAERLAALGFMPLAAFPFEARIRVGGIRSIAAPPARLGAWWNG
jgi:type VI secretion system protein ImpC